MVTPVSDSGTAPQQPVVSVLLERSRRLVRRRRHGADRTPALRPREARVRCRGQPAPPRRDDPTAARPAGRSPRRPGGAAAAYGGLRSRPGGAVRGDRRPPTAFSRPPRPGPGRIDAGHTLSTGGAERPPR